MRPPCKKTFSPPGYRAVTITSLAVKAGSLGFQILVKINWIIPKQLENPT